VWRKSGAPHNFLPFNSSTSDDSEGLLRARIVNHPELLRLRRSSAAVMNVIEYFARRKIAQRILEIGSRPSKPKHRLARGGLRGSGWGEPGAVAR